MLLLLLVTRWVCCLERSAPPRIYGRSSRYSSRYSTSTSECKGSRSHRHHRPRPHGDRSATAILEAVPNGRSTSTVPPSTQTLPPCTPT